MTNWTADRNPAMPTPDTCDTNRCGRLSAPSTEGDDSSPKQGANAERVTRRRAVDTHLSARGAPLIRVAGVVVRPVGVESDPALQTSVRIQSEHRGSRAKSGETTS